MKSIKLFIFIFLLACLSPGMLFAGKTGTITGLVVDDTTGIGMSWVTVAVKQANIAVNTDINGVFNLTGVPEGTDTVTVSFLGYETQRVVINMKAGQDLRLTVTMKPAVINTGEVVIYGQAKGQIKANEEQFESPLIVNVVSGAKMQEFPDANAAEAIGRLPGISLTRTNGEADKLVIRGLSPQWNYVTLEGFQMPSTNYTDRSVDMSLLPSDIFSGVEVYKALRADLDANALGGTVNMRLPKAAQIQKFEIGAEGGYAFLNSSFANYIVRIGYSNRFFNKRLGVNIKASREQKDRPQQQFTGNYASPTPAPSSSGEYLKISSTGITLNDIQLHTTRSNADIILDYGTSWWDVKLFSLFSQKLDRETQRQFKYYWLMTSGTNNENLDQTLYSQLWITDNLMNTLQNEFRIGSTKLDIALNLSLVNQRFTEDNFPFIENQNGVLLAASSLIFGNPAALYNSPGFSGILKGHPKSSTLTNMNNDGQELVDRNMGSNLDYEIPYKIAEFIDGKIKLGGKMYDLTRHNQEFYYQYQFQYGNGSSNRTSMLTYYKVTSAVSSTGVGGIDAFSFVDNGYNPGKFINGTYSLPYSYSFGNLINDDLGLSTRTVKNAKGQIVKIGTAVPNTSNEWSNTYSSTEHQQASYILTEFTIDKIITVVPGLRYEKNSTASTGIQFEQASNPNDISGVANHVTTKRFEADYFPSVNLKYQVTKLFNILGDIYKSTTRPDFNDYSPTIAYPTSDQGNFNSYNPFLKDALAWNYDLSFQYLNKTIGLFSASAYYKVVQDLEVYQSNYNLAFQNAGLIGAPSNLTQIVPPLSYYTIGAVNNGAVINSLPINNPSKAYIKGIELSWQTNLSYLTGLLKGIVFEVNYSLINSSTNYVYTYSTQVGNATDYYWSTRKGELINQPAYKIQGNIGWDYKGFSIRFSYSYQAKTLSSLDSRYSVNDTYISPVSLADLMIKQKITHNISCFLSMTNLTKQVDNSYNSSFVQMVNGVRTVEPSLPQTSQYYGIRGQIGINVNL